jgi:EAL domain-containing protein (putative c-di-GMP-specific phosphodiesterase class I)
MSASPLVAAAPDVAPPFAWLQPTFRVTDGTLHAIDAVPAPGAGDADRGPAVAGRARRSEPASTAGEATIEHAIDGLRSLGGRAGCPLVIGATEANLCDPTFADRLLARVDAAGVRPGDIVVGVSESRLVEGSLLAVEVLTRLAMRGFGLLLDDFGTGWSSLALLAQVPFGELRIDARFVTAAVVDDAARDVVDSSVHLARRLGLAVSARGVEERAHWDLCGLLGIDAGQGTASGPPVPPERFAQRYLRGARG